MRRNSFGALVALCMGMVLSGCESSPWESQYHSLGVTVPGLGPADRVVIREVAWDRVQGTLTQLEAERSASDVHVDDWTEEQKAAAKARLLRGLQVSGDPKAVELLGRSDFRTTSAVRPDDGSLESFARRIGATKVVWARQYLGKTDRVQQESATELRTRTWTGGKQADGTRRTYTSTENATVFYPVVVKADENAWVAFFLRDR